MLEKVDNNKMRHSERGVAVVEFSILAVIFLVIVFGLLEFSVMFFQKHYIAGAVREGVRTGVIANNYECFNGGCGSTVDRYEAVYARVEDYLLAIFDSEDILAIDIERIPDAGETSESVELKVEVRVNNFMPEMIAGLIPGYTRPDTFSSAASGLYEDPSEL